MSSNKTIYTYEKKKPLIILHNKLNLHNLDCYNLKYMIRSLFLFVMLLAMLQLVKAQISFQTLHKKDGSETKQQEEAYFIRVIDYPSTKGDPFKVQEYFISTNKLKLFGTYNDLSRKQFIGPKVEAFENGKVKSKEMYSNDSQLIDTAMYYYEDGKLKLAFNYLYEIKKENTIKVTDTLILIFRDSLGKTLLSDGNGYAEIQESKNAIAKGQYKDHKRIGPWTGSFNNNRYTFTETYEEGKLVSGLTKDSLGQMYPYNDNNFLIEPQYPGGIERLRQYIGDNYKYPPTAIREGVSGTVRVAFVVEKDGNIVDLKVEEDIGHGTGEAAIAALQYSKRWKPGVIRGVPVRIQFNLPIRLNLSR